MWPHLLTNKSLARGGSFGPHLNRPLRGPTYMRYAPLLGPPLNTFGPTHFVQQPLIVPLPGPLIEGPPIGGPL